MGGAKRSSLNQTLNEIEIDSFLDIRIDGWIYLSIHIYFARSPKSLIWPGNKALLWAQEAKGMSSAASPPHLRAIGALLSSYFFIGRFGWTSPFFPNENGKGCITSRCRFVFRPK
uniref:Orf142 n=1 Tax=Phoenix dactylifera TaxID=42345 RepID=A0A2R4FZG4_PHODC|nr:orf142 [Phoenix dactylifera]